MNSKPASRLLCAVLLAALPFTSAVNAATTPFVTTESSAFLIVGTQAVGTNTDVNVNNFELGANRAPVPANTDFVDNNGGPSLEGNVPNLPAGITPFFQGIDFSGNIAVTDPAGTFNLQDVGVFGDPSIGIRLAGTSPSLNTSDNAFFNDPNGFPNTFDVATQTGMDVNPNDADQSTRIDNPINAGVSFGFNPTSLLNELDAARSYIINAPATNTLTPGNGSDLSNNASIAGPGGATLSFDNSNNGQSNINVTLNAAPGLNVIDLDLDGDDFLLNEANFIIDGGEDSIVIFRLRDKENLLISNSNLLIGDGGIGENSVLFFAGDEDNDGTNFGFDNTLINGVAFWSVGNEGIININNAQGSTQLIGDQVVLNDVRFTRWAFAPGLSLTAVPEPSTVLLAGIASALLAARKRR